MYIGDDVANFDFVILACLIRVPHRSTNPMQMKSTEAYV